MIISKFIIHRYKAIINTIEFNLQKQSLIPIIGLNECGKTSILSAIYAFDATNDSSDSTMRQLSDVSNLYNTKTEPAKISAEIIIDVKDLEKALIETFPLKEETETPFWKNFNFPKTMIISRIIHSKQLNNYEVEIGDLTSLIPDQDLLGRSLILTLPYILYFDDFRDSFPDRIEIDKKDAENSNTWLSIIEKLFKKTDANYSVHDLSKLEQRNRNNILSDVERYLNNTLTKEWADFKLDEKENLYVKITIDTEENEVKVDNPPETPNLPAKTIKTVKTFLSFEVKEIDKNGRERSFFVKDRSKGFYWFFNFVMKVEFNSKNAGEEGQDTIYLLDEPGSYLHSFAQQRLCKKLKKISDDNVVIYSTHSHHLLSPEVIPINSVFLAYKPQFGEVSIRRVIDVSLKEKEQTPLAYQTYYDALNVKPDIFNFTYKKALLVEGIYDFYCYKMFIFDNSEICVIPSRGADSLISFISLMLGFGIDFVTLWDNDEAGKKKKDKAIDFFGKEFNDRFLLLPLKSNKNKCRLEELFHHSDLKIIKEELSLPNNSSFEKIIVNLFYSSKKEEIKAKIGKETMDNFRELTKLITFN